MRSIRPLLAKLWADERGISAVEYAMLLAMIAGGIIMGAELLSDAVSNEMKDTAGLSARILAVTTAPVRVATTPAKSRANTSRGSP